MISATGLFSCVMPLLGLVIDKFGPAWTSFIVLTLQVIAALGMMYLHSSWVALVIFVFLFADINGIMLACFGILLRSIFGPKNFTKINSYMQIGAGMVGMLGAPLISLVAVTFGSYATALWLAIGFCILIATLFIIGFLCARKLVWEDGTRPNPFKPYKPAAEAAE
jgi:MFS family permease